MELRFLGNGSAFSPTHTNAYFYYEDNLFFIDLSMYSVEKAKKLVTSDINNIFILLTHLHSDHASGIGLFAQWCYYMKGKVPYFVSDAKLKNDILEDMKATGVERHLFKILSIDDCSMVQFDKNDIYDDDAKTRIQKIISTHLIKTIPTKHVPNLYRKCFGFKLNTGNKIIVYTGDTATLNPYLSELSDADEFYCEMSFHYGVVHLLWSEQKDILLPLSENINVYLMHLDDEKAIEKAIKGTKIEIVKGAP